MAQVLSLTATLCAAETHKASSKPLKLAKTSRETKTKTPIYNPRKGKSSELSFWFMRKFKKSEMMGSLKTNT